MCIRDSNIAALILYGLDVVLHLLLLLSDRVSPLGELFGLRVGNKVLWLQSLVELREVRAIRQRCGRISQDLQSREALLAHRILWNDGRAWCPLQVLRELDKRATVLQIR